MNDPLPQTNAIIPVLSLVGTTKVPNTFPSIEPTNYRLAVVGEAPGADEEAYGQPFVGASGKLLDSILSSVGILRQACFIGNVCPYRPPGNDITEWGYDHPKVLDGWAELQQQLAAFAPNCVLALGNTPLHFLCGKTGVTSWRGSILQNPTGYKVVPAIHPAAVLRDYKQWPLLRFDAQRALREASSRELSLPNRLLTLDLSANEICNRLDNWPRGSILSFDIEGGLDAFPCCSVAGAPNSGFIIAWSKFDSTSQGRIAVALSRILYSTSIPKVLQNSLYDRFVLAYGFGILIRNVVEDTMLKQWEIYPELPKGLGTIASIWTREPYYKSEIKSDDRDTFYRYCIKDSCVTLEACLAMEGAMDTAGSRHYKFNVSLLNALLYMELRGFNYDGQTAQAELLQVKSALAECRSRIELKVPLTQWTKKELSNSICGTKGSISAQRLARVLYEFKGYPVQRAGRGPTAKITTDVDALLKIRKHKAFTNDPFLADILLHRKLESIQETLEVSTDPDGRIRCGYNLVGTETGRLTCYTSPTGSGANLQTITKKLRKLYRADAGYWLFQCDLSGADGWTVAAHCLRHGDPTMWDDYNYGLKPAKLVALMYQGFPVSRMNREQLLALSNEESKPGASCDSDGWLYFACKRVQHATNYGVTEKTGADQVMKDSYKLTGNATYIEPSTFGSLQRLYFARYPGLYQWHGWCERQVFEGKNLTSSSGHTRKFFGRRKSWDTKKRQMSADHETWKEFMADEPQENTTYATNLALWKLWFDPENRSCEKFDSLVATESYKQDMENNGKGSCATRNILIIEPIHTVHDALIGQFPKEHTAWAISKIRSYFSNPLRIADTELIIPFEGAYGPSWGELGPKYGGGTI